MIGNNVLNSFARKDRVKSKENKSSILVSTLHSEIDSNQFHPETLHYLSKTLLAHRKRLGQYFTPKSIREQLLELLPKGEKYDRILDPSCGTGEFLLSARAMFPAAELAGWEIDPKPAGVANDLCPWATISPRDALITKPDELGTWDLVIGNPPYFELAPNPEVRSKYRQVISGRANIFSFFIQEGLSLLRPGGILAFVVPQSMNNGAYFSALRRYILEQGAILHLDPVTSADHFLDAQQTVMLFVVQKGGKSDNKVFRRNGFVIFSPDPQKLEQLFVGRPTLAELGFYVRTGRIVWNQCRPLLRRKRSEGEVLLWSHNIGSDGIELIENHPKRPQYIAATDPDCGPAIIVNRITGASLRAVLRATVVPEGMRFFAENHINVVYPCRNEGNLFKNNTNSASVPIERVAAALCSTSAVQAAKLITGNTQISARELENLVPLDV